MGRTAEESVAVVVAAVAEVVAVVVEAAAGVVEVNPIQARHSGSGRQGSC